MDYNIGRRDNAIIWSTIFKNREAAMKKHGIVCLVVFFAVFCIMAAAGSAQAQEKVIKLKYSNFFPPVHKMSTLADQWCKEVEKRTNGRVKINYFPSSTLVPANQAYEAVVKGIADISMITQQYNTGRFPLTEGIYLPLGVKSSRQATKMVAAWYEKFKPKEYDDAKVLYLYGSGPGNFATLKPLASIKDLKGLKVRCAGDTAKIVAAMGAVPVSIPLADSYDGFQRGVIQGSLLPLESLKGWRFGDLLRGAQINDGLAYTSALGVVMSKQKWASLPADIQKIIEQIDKEWLEKTGAAWDEIDKEGVDFAVSKGLKVFKISKEEAAVTSQKMKPILDDYVKSMKKLGLPGEESLKFLQNWLKANPNP
jgi:TRAP-type transport system periplasmic protein